MDLSIVRCGGRRPFDQMARKSEVAIVGNEPRSGRERASTTGELGDFTCDNGVGSRLEARGVAVVPASVETPDVADNELGLVVHRPEVRALLSAYPGAEGAFEMRWDIGL